MAELKYITLFLDRQEYSIRRSDYEEYRCFMECCERKYQVKVINGLLYEMKEMQKEMFS